MYDWLIDSYSIGLNRGSHPYKPCFPFQPCFSSTYSMPFFSVKRKSFNSSGWLSLLTFRPVAQILCSHTRCSHYGVHFDLNTGWVMTCQLHSLRRSILPNWPRRRPCVTNCTDAFANAGVLSTRTPDFLRMVIDRMRWLNRQSSKMCFTVCLPHPHGHSSEPALLILNR